LLRQVQGGVPAGCTAESQVTDTGFASCSKAAGVREKDAVREVMRLKARKEKVSPSYKAGAREIMQIAQAIHDAMVLQNSQKNTVLREYMSCGWGAWRPQQGRLVPAGSQDWARHLPEQSSRIRDEARQDRMNWLDANGKPVLPSDQPEQIVPDQLEKTYCPLEQTPEEAERSCVLDLELGWLAGTEQQAAEAALRHPNDRTVQETYALAIEKMSSQVKQGKKGRLGSKPA